MSSYEPAINSRPQRLKMEEYAYNADVQNMFQAMISDVLQEQPQDTVAYLISWLQKEQERRGGRAVAAAAEGGDEAAAAAAAADDQLQ